MLTLAQIAMADPPDAARPAHRGASALVPL